MTTLIHDGDRIRLIPEPMKIGVIGAGRLGICFALLAESVGHDVYVSDVRSHYVDQVNAKEICSNEPEVEDLLLRSKKLRATTSNSEVIKHSDIIFTFVPTPSLDDGSYDCSLVDSVVCDLLRAPNLEGKKFIVGCTTNPGYVDQVDKRLEGKGISVFYSPEFVAQGSIVRDMRKADMILCGGRDDEGFEKIKLIYTSFMDSDVNFYPMSNTAAEITKISINCFLTYKISYANMIGQILYKAGCGDEIPNILSSIGADSRIGSKYLNYGLGFGGPCLPRDNRALGHYADRVGLKYSLPQVTDDFNEAHADFIKNYCVDRNTEGLPFFIDSIGYKIGCDLVVESPRLRLVEDLLKDGHKVYVQEIDDVINQYAEEMEEEYNDNIIFVKSQNEIYERTWRIDL
tara:strand:- start:1770 stop:2972 length:1203 start_codon:yes stop_codon:yes gene_type:complete